MLWSPLHSLSEHRDGKEMETMISVQRGERKKLPFNPKNVSSDWAKIFLDDCSSEDFKRL